jgi:hypothetical protein
MSALHSLDPSFGVFHRSDGVYYNVAGWLLGQSRRGNIRSDDLVRILIVYQQASSICEDVRPFSEEGSTPELDQEIPHGEFSRQQVEGISAALADNHHLLEAVTGVSGPVGQGDIVSPLDRDPVIVELHYGSRYDLLVSLWRYVNGEQSKVHHGVKVDSLTLLGFLIGKLKFPDCRSWKERPWPFFPIKDRDQRRRFSLLSNEIIIGQLRLKGIIGSMDSYVDYD